jgi:3-phenylpropionate/trans-cinnamate dioxygenase ferredoxin subunit
MEGWTRVCARDEMAPGEFRVVEADGTMIAVFNIDGHHYAIEDVCTHDGGELAGGPVHGFEIECPRHGARFDVRTGAVCAPPAQSPTASFPVRVDDDGVWTRDDRWD